MTQLFIRAACTAVICGSLAAPAFAQQVSVVLKDGLVTVKAENATVRQILDEWARVGQAKVINADKLGTNTLTLSLANVPERQALDIILRGTAGYLAVDRATMAANVSSYERILVMNKTTQALASAAPSGPSVTTPVYTPPAQADSFQNETDNVAMANASEPPPPTNAPVASPYAAGAGVGMATGGAGTAYNNSGVLNSASGSGGSANTAIQNPADVKFDYANPVPYFEAQRQLQQQQQQAQQGPTTTPGATQQLLSQPGIAPAPQPNTATPATGTGTNSFNPYNPPANFNPYNLKPGETIPGTTPQQQNVTPDRSKYANPYQPQP